MNAAVVQRIEVTPGLIILRVVPDGWPLPDFKAGQFAVLGLPPGSPRCPVCDPEEEPAKPSALIKRAYSIASSSVTKEFLEFYILLVPSGRLTPRLFALNPGDPLWLSEKTKGVFSLDQVPRDKHVIFVSTGTGLAPYMSMLRSHLVCGGNRRFAVLHGARHSWDLGYRSELMTLRQMCKNFTYIPTISRPEAEPLPWMGASGYVQELWDRRVLERAQGQAPSPDDTHVFLCGNPSMVDRMLERLTSQGFQEHTGRKAGQIHLERYW